MAMSASGSRIGYSGDFKAKPEALKATGGAWETPDCPQQVPRGGSYNFKLDMVQSAFRGKEAAGNRQRQIEVRIVRNVGS